MALTPLQQRICRLLADTRKRSGQSYVAGGVALNQLLGGSRQSEDIDLFHDTQAALSSALREDRATLLADGLGVETLRDHPSFVEARVRSDDETALVQWVQDSAYRFFPLVEHDLLGLTLHPFDVATNKVLAVAGRREVRDWVDAIQCHEKVQALGYLAWAASGKDQGLGPGVIVEEAARVRYSEPEFAALVYEGPPPILREVAVRWRQAIAEAREIIERLPPEYVGQCVLDTSGQLMKASPQDLERELAAGRVAFHAGRIRGAYPEVLRDR
jgi:hypothetical protein